jgi:UDP-N-acetylmuramoylalanine-D-glutamate ligase
MGESGHELAKRYQDDRFIVAESLEDAVNTAKKEAENLTKAIALMSPSAASFDMFENVYDRGTKYQTLIRSLT